MPATKKQPKAAPIDMRVPEDFKPARTEEIRKFLHQNEMLLPTPVDDDDNEDEEFTARVNAVLDALSESDRADVIAWARAALWMTDGRSDWLGTPINAVATRAEVTPPACIAALVHPDFATTEAFDAVIGNGARIIDPDPVAVDEVKLDGDQILLVEEPEGEAPAPVGAMAFQSPEDVSSVALSLRARAEDLASEAKRLSSLGRHGESKNLLNEAARIREALLPQLQTQRDIPFNEQESLNSAITRIVGNRVRSAVVRTNKNFLTIGVGETHDEVAKREEQLADFERLVGSIAELTAAAIMPVVREVSERAFAAGKSAREVTPEFVAREAVQSVQSELAAA